MRPRVICHMMSSIDGRIVVDHWPDLGDSRHAYEQTADTFEADGWMCGRITMEPFASGLRDAAEVAREAQSRPADAPPREDFVAPGPHESYAVAVDPSGRLVWESGDLDGDHLVTVLTDRVSDAYLAGLREAGVSYVLATGSDGEVDMAAALRRLADAFGIRTLLLEGGGRINGGMLRDGLIDEVSLLVAPVTDATIGTPALFDVDDAGSAARRLALESVERRPGDFLWLRYRVEPGAGAK